MKEMLRPMLKAWLDDNLPPLVERLVREEIERVVPPPGARAFFGEVGPVRRQKMRQTEEDEVIPCKWKQLEDCRASVDFDRSVRFVAVLLARSSRQLAGIHHDGQDVRSRRRRGAHLHPLGGGRGLQGRARGSQGRGTVHDRHPAAERDRLAPHGARPQQHDPGHPLPLRAHARQGRAVAAGHGPCRHRHADGRRAPARRSARSSAATSAATNSSSGSGSGRRSPAAPSCASSSASAPPATGRASASPWTRACRRPC